MWKPFCAVGEGSVVSVGEGQRKKVKSAVGTPVKISSSLSHTCILLYCSPDREVRRI